MKNKNVPFWLNEVFTSVAALFFLLMVGICFLQVIARYFFSSAFDWPEEALRFLFIWLAYLGMAYGVYTDSHLKVDILLMAFDKRGRKLINLLCHIVTLAFVIFVGWQGWLMLDIVIDSEEVALTLPVPLYLIWFAIPFSFALSAIYSIYNMLVCLKDGEE